MSTENQEYKHVSRRKFLKSAVVGAAAISGSGLIAGCTPSIATPEAAEQPPSGEAVGGSASGYSWETPPAPIPAADIKQTYSADVVVVGAGVSGLMAAFSAAEAGAKTILIEKSEKYNARGGHNAAISSKVQKEEGLNYDRNQVVRDLVRWSSNNADSGQVMLWASHVDEYMDMLLGMAEKAGLEISRYGNDIPNEYYPEYSTVHMFGGMDENILAGMLETAGKEKGVEFHYSTPAEQLIRGSDGRVSGVVAKNAEGAYVQFDASKGVILATGDYGNDPEMIQRYCPAAANVDVNVYAPPVNTGDGHKMGLWAGASMQDDEPHTPMIHNLGAPPFSGNPFLRVNALGLRYENEDVPIPYLANSVQKQPGRKTWTIYDSTFADDLPLVTPGFSRATAMSEWTQASIDSGLEAGTMLFKADTLDELAGKMGIPADAFKATVERYNELAAKGVDEDFGKGAAMMTLIDTPPYYAAFNMTALLVVLGGLKVNTSLQVLDKDGKVIPGLFASGNAAGGFFSNDYPVIVPGLSHSRAWTFGRIAGQNAANG